MQRIIKSRHSRADYLEIWRYIARDDVKAADRLVALLDRKVKLLASSPSIGMTEDDLASGLRSLPVGSYLIFYRPIKEGIELVRVVHGARDITAEYFSE